MKILLELTKFYDVNMHLDNIITLARYQHNSNLQRFRCHLYINYLIPEKTPHSGSMIPTNPQESQLKTFIATDAEDTAMSSRSMHASQIQFKIYSNSSPIKNKLSKQVWRMSLNLIMNTKNLQIPIILPINAGNPRTRVAQKHFT